MCFSMQEKQQINRADRVFFIVFLLVIIIVTLITFIRIVILKDYQIEAQVSCNPSIEKCFSLTCDPSSDDTCSATTTDRTIYYKKISKKAFDIFACGQTREKIGCDTELSCTKDERNFGYTYCDENNLADEEQCSK